MRNLFTLDENTDSSHAFPRHQLAKKVSIALLYHVYMQMNLAMFASVICASIIFAGFYFSQGNHVSLLICFGCFAAVTVLRLLITAIFKQQRITESNEGFWRDLYIVGALLGGLSWGLSAVFLFQEGGALQQTFLILMLAGVSSGAVILSSAIPSSAIGFLITAIAPYLIVIGFMRNKMYLFFDVTLALYFVYAVVITLSVYKLIRHSFMSKYDNELLISSLSEAKKHLDTTHKKLEVAAATDALTNLPNRCLLLDSLNRSIAQAKSTKKLFALFHFDLDHFNAINDLYGNFCADRILVTVSERLKKYFGNHAIIHRVGGNEFTIILENMNSVEEIVAIATQTCRLMAIPIHVDQVELNVSASIGVSVYPDDAMDAQTLTKLADKTMRYVKSHGGNNFALHLKLAKVQEPAE